MADAEVSNEPSALNLNPLLATVPPVFVEDVNTCPFADMVTPPSAEAGLGATVTMYSCPDASTAPGFTV